MLALRSGGQFRRAGPDEVRRMAFLPRNNEVELGTLENPDGKAGEWQITGWKTEEMHWSASPRRLFVEALDTALRPPQDVAKLRRSQHYEATVKYYREGMKIAAPSLFCADLREPEGGHRRGRHRWGRL